MLQLPPVVLERLLSYLGKQDLQTVSRLSKAHYALTQSDQFWAGLLRERFHYSLPLASWSSARSIFLRFDSGMRYRAEFHGAHTSNPTYWNLNYRTTESIFGEVSHVRGVWWLEGAIRIQKVPPGRYGVIWRVAHASGALPFFHVVAPLRAAKSLNVASTMDVLNRRKGDGWIQKVVGMPLKDEVVEMPRTTHTFASRSDGTNWPDDPPWRLFVFPSSLIITEISDVYCGVFEVSGGYHSGYLFDWVQLLPLRPDDPATIHSHAFAAVKGEMAAKRVADSG